MISTRFAHCLHWYSYSGITDPSLGSNRARGTAIPLSSVRLRQRDDLRVGVLFRREQLAVSEVNTGHPALSGAVVPGVDHRVAPVGAHGPAGDRRSQNVGHLSLRHPFL